MIDLLGIDNTYIMSIYEDDSGSGVPRKYERRIIIYGWSYRQTWGILE